MSDDLFNGIIGVSAVVFAAVGVSALLFPKLRKVSALFIPAVAKVEAWLEKDKK